VLFFLSDDFFATVISFFFFSVSFCLLLFLKGLVVLRVYLYMGNQGRRTEKNQKGKIEVIATFGRSQSTIHSFIHYYLIELISRCPRPKEG
jgi:hypothetical protein